MLLACMHGPEERRSVREASMAPTDFWAHWGDGRAEINGYTVVQPRYGSLRSGEAVHIYVTETMRHDKRVKADGPADDAFPVMKLNATLDFQTGIYDYSVMSSTFVPLSGETPRGIPTKVSFSMQEWCGITHAEIKAEHAFGEPASHLSLSNHHYFDRKNVNDTTLLVPDNGIAADALPILVRGLAGSFAPSDTRRSVAVAPRLYDSHTRDIAWTWHEATLVGHTETQATTVPAGSFVTRTIEITLAGDLSYRYAVERDHPYRIIAWDGPQGERGELTGTLRSKYWNQQHPEHVRLRGNLGLSSSAWSD